MICICFFISFLSWPSSSNHQGIYITACLLSARTPLEEPRDPHDIYYPVLTQHLPFFKNIGVRNDKQPLIFPINRI